LEKAEIEVEGANPVHHEEIERGRVVSWWQDDVEKPAEVAKGSAIVLIVSQGPQPRKIPNLAGRTFDEAKVELEKLGLKAEKVEDFSRTVEKGKVIRTEPAAGATAERGGTVKVLVSKGRDLVAVPNLAGMSIAQATAALDKAGLERGDVFGRGETVFDSQPKFGTKIDRGSVVDLYVRP
jgi:beta-lactam-binding protein with PASTA domain